MALSVNYTDAAIDLFAEKGFDETTVEDRVAQAYTARLKSGSAGQVFDALTQIVCHGSARRRLAANRSGVP